MTATTRKKKTSAIGSSVKFSKLLLTTAESTEAVRIGRHLTRIWDMEKIVREEWRSRK